MAHAHTEPDARPAAARLAKAPFDQMVLVCGKCARKLPGRGAKQVRAQLKSALKGRRWGKVRVVESRCLDLCPKRRQVLASARTLADRRLVVVDPQFDATLALTQLLGPPRGDEEKLTESLAGDLSAPASLNLPHAELVEARNDQAEGGGLVLRQAEDGDLCTNGPASFETPFGAPQDDANC